MFCEEMFEKKNLEYLNKLYSDFRTSTDPAELASLQTELISEISMILLMPYLKKTSLDYIKIEKKN